jgi:thiosulfate dehydrogenase
MIRGAIVRAVVLAVLGSVAATHSAAFEGPEDTELGPVFLLTLGGKLYDDVWLALGREPPPQRNPAVPADAAIDTRASWRCVSCHGWSYSGAEIGGASYPGLSHLAGADVDFIRTRILDPAHPFPAADFPDLALDLLAFFVRDGLHDRTEFLDEDGRSIGNPEFGRDIFEGACISCHQLDGRRYLEGERGDRSSLGWVVRNRPEQALHKILNGVPGAEMLALRFLSVEQIADLIAYLQVLDPAEN